jgi:hypothetical protein
LATALTIADVVVIPIAVPVESLVNPLRMAIQDFDRLMLVPGHIDLDLWWRPVTIVLVGRPGTRDLEGFAAERLIKTIVYPLNDKSIKAVKYTTAVSVVINEINNGCKAKNRNVFTTRGVARAIGTFVAGNEFAEYLELDE